MSDYRLQSIISRKKVDKLETQLFNAIILISDLRDETLEELEPYAIQEIGITQKQYRKLMRLE